MTLPAEFQVRMDNYGLAFALMAWEHKESREDRPSLLANAEKYKLHLTLEGFYNRMIIGGNASMADYGEMWPEWEF